MAAPRIDCHRCAHYFVTWDPGFPHGCRQMGFKSRMIPCVEVRQAMSGHECLLFQAKSQNNSVAARLSSLGASERPLAN